MAQATYPAVFFDDAANNWKCEMKDKITQKVWGAGYGENRKQAIYNARHSQPNQRFIKRSIGWTSRHPFWGGMLVGLGLACFTPKKNIKLGFGGTAIISIACGTAFWIVNKILEKTGGD